MFRNNVISLSISSAPQLEEFDLSGREMQGGGDAELVRIPEGRTVIP